jgi:hypothetical protein
MRIALIHNVVFRLNNIPKAGQDYSPKDLVFGEQLLNYKTICRIPFGAYAQVHDDPSITNAMESRTTGAISLGMTGNIQGTYSFLHLRTGEIIDRWTWNELPIPSDVIDRVDELTANEPEYENDINIEEDDAEEDDTNQNQNLENVDDDLPITNIANTDGEMQPTVETEDANGANETEEIERENELENDIEDVGEEENQSYTHGYMDTTFAPIGQEIIRIVLHSVQFRLV